MNYQTENIKIKETCRGEVAAALMELASFPQGSFLGRINNAYGVGNGRECSIAFHKEILDKLNGDIGEAVAYHRPHIIVGEVLRPPEGKEKEYQPTGEYAIGFDTEKIHPLLIGKLEGQIRSHYPAKDASMGRGKV